ncbi:MAG: hypothetical protein J2P17_08835 [Mycobacterium sp.]|nr:hypothetical protein [Mycobacterium sp.]
MTPADNNTFVGAFTTAPWTLRNRADGVLDDPGRLTFSPLLGRMEVSS